MSESDAAEVTVVNADNWVARSEQLAVLLSTAADGDVIPDAEGNPADPQRLVALSGLPYWSENPTALHDALSEVTGTSEARPGGPDLAPGAVGWGPERLTLTVEEVAVTLGISLSHAYEAIRRGEIPAIRIGRRVLVPRAALESLLEGGSPQPPPRDFRRHPPQVGSDMDRRNSRMVSSDK